MRLEFSALIRFGPGGSERRVEDAVLISFSCLRRRRVSSAGLRPGSLEPGGMIMIPEAVVVGDGALNVTGDLVDVGGDDGRSAAGVFDRKLRFLLFSPILPYVSELVCLDFIITTWPDR